MPTFDLSQWSRSCVNMAKRLDSPYEPDSLSGAWRKMRINLGQEFVIGGYTVGGKTFDAVMCGYFENGQFVYVARTRNGFTPSVREQLYRRFRGLETSECPFANQPEARSGRRGQGLTAEKMKRETGRISRLAPSGGHRIWEPI